MSTPAICAWSPFGVYSLTLLSSSSILRGPLHILCWRESICPHCEQELVSIRRMAANRSLVGMIPFIAAYHVDFTVSDTLAACKFFHTRSQRIPGYFRTIRSSVFLFPVLAILSSTPYMPCLKFFIVSSVPGGVTLAISMAYWRK